MWEKKYTFNNYLVKYYSKVGDDDDERRISNKLTKQPTNYLTNQPHNVVSVFRSQ
jgi:hypothetical protein